MTGIMNYDWPKARKMEYAMKRVADSHYINKACDEIRSSIVHAVELGYGGVDITYPITTLEEDVIEDILCSLEASGYDIVMTGGEDMSFEVWWGGKGTSCRKMESKS